MTHTLEQGSPARHICNSQRLYLDLLLKSVLGLIAEDPPLPRFGKETFDLKARIEGLDWPTEAETMVGLKRLINARQLVENVLCEDVPGDILEAGVWRGGVGILMRGVLAAYGVTDRRIWMADSFEGLPAPNKEDFPLDSGSEFHTCPELAIDIETVKQNFRKYDLLDDQVVFLKGWFKDTLPEAPIENIALLRLDGDLYESTMQALVALYDKVSEKGYIIIDDYHYVPQCAQAVEDFCAMKNIEPVLNEIDGVGVFWQKQSSASDLSVQSSDGVSGHDQDGQNQGVMDQDARFVKISQVLNKRYIQLAERDVLITEKEALLAERGEMIAERDARLADNDRHIAEQNAAIAERDEQIAGLDAQLAALTSARDTEVQHLKYMIELMENSRSWRITAPLRYITSDLFGKQ